MSREGAAAVPRTVPKRRASRIPQKTAADVGAPLGPRAIVGPRRRSNGRPMVHGLPAAYARTPDADSRQSTGPPSPRRCTSLTTRSCTTSSLFLCRAPRLYGQRTEIIAHGAKPGKRAKAQCPASACKSSSVSLPLRSYAVLRIPARLAPAALTRLRLGTGRVPGWPSWMAWLCIAGPVVPATCWCDGRSASGGAKGRRCSGWGIVSQCSAVQCSAVPCRARCRGHIRDELLAFFRW